MMAGDSERGNFRMGGTEKGDRGKRGLKILRHHADMMLKNLFDLLYIASIHNTSRFILPVA